MSPLGAIVIGAGQAGLAASYHLSQRGIEHVVLERGRIGQTWRSQRWDTFCLNTPDWLSHVLGADRDDPDAGADGYLSAGAFVGRLEAHAERYRAPVRTGAEVTRVALGPTGDGFAVSVGGTQDGTELRATSVVVASGIQNVPRIPPLGAALPADLRQVTTAAYRAPADLPSGSVLVVGGAQSGVQIAEDLLASGRAVYQCTSRVGRLPRRYRGRDTIAWLHDAGFYDRTPEQLADPATRWTPIPQVSGVGPRGHTVSLQGLAARGVTLLGRPTAVEGGRLILDDTVGVNIAFGDQVSADIKRLVDTYIEASGREAPAVESDPADDAHPDPAAVHSPAELDLDAAGIGSVVWATGFRGDFGYLPTNVLDDRLVPIHDRGVSPLPGLFFVGFPWLTNARSGIIPGVDADAAAIAAHVAHRITTDIR